MENFQKKRLLKHAAFLESVPKHRFDLCVIAEVRGKEKKPGLNTCGTAACAIGWMPTSFPRYCKYDDWYNYFDDETEKEFSVNGKGDYGGLVDFELAEAFFGINSEQSEYLFDPSRYNIRKGAKTVAHRIRKFVEENGKTYDEDGHVAYNPNLDGEDKEDNYEDENSNDYDLW